jgi:hypothetical protein
MDIDYNLNAFFSEDPFTTTHISNDLKECNDPIIDDTHF